MAEDLKNQRQKNDAKGKKALSDQVEMGMGDLGKNEDILSSYEQEKLDEMYVSFGVVFSKLCFTVWLVVWRVIFSF